MEKTRRRLIWKRVAIVGSIVVIVLGAGVILLLSNQALEAEFADSVLRPLLGPQRVIALENIAFGVQDRFNQISKKQLPAADFRAASSPTPPLNTSTTGTPSSNSPLPVLAPIKPLLTASLGGEGQWSELGTSGMLSTFVRTDPDRPYSVVNLVYIPMSHLALGLMAGTKFPGGPAGPGKVPADIQADGRLLAAFNGGFRASDGNYGMEVNNVTYVPFRKNMATLRIFTDGHADITNYDGQPFPPNVVAARQNGPLLVADGKVSSETNGGGIDLWAGTAGGGFITWRSGLGLTATGDLVYAVGDSLTPAALATALQLGGAKTALQLDINAFWVRFMLYEWKGSAYTSSRLIPALADGGSAYLKRLRKRLLLYL